MRSAPGNFDELRARLARELEVREEHLTRDARFVGDLGVSSINAIIVVMALEDWFGLRITDEQAEVLRTLADTHAFLETQGIDLESASKLA